MMDFIKKNLNILKNDLEANRKKHNPDVVVQTTESEQQVRPGFKSTSHFLHFCLTMCSFGFWLLPWILFTLTNSQANKRNGWR